MEISACWIVKNEEANIARSIESLHEIADELIVVDTGSKDKTIEIAGGYGAKIYHFEWTCDFSDARNYALSKANGDIILFLDADEWFSPKLISENRKTLGQIIKDNNWADGISFDMHNLDTQTGLTVSKCAVVRAFRNKPYLKYTQKIHEQLIHIESKRFITAVHFDGWTLLHSGYSPDIVNKKAARNIEMLEDAGRNGKMSALESFYMMRENHAIGNYEEAFKYFEKLLRDEAAVTELASKYGGRTGIAGSYFYLALNLAVRFRSRVCRRELYDKLVKKMGKCLPDFPGTSSYHLAYQVYFDLKEDTFLGDLEEYEKLPQKEPVGIDDGYLSAVAAIYKTASIIYWRRSDYEKAAKYAAFYLKYDVGFDEKIMTVLLDCQRDHNDADIVRLITDTFDLSSETILKQVTDRLKLKGLKIPYLYFLKRQIDSGIATIADFLYMIILTGKYKKAVQAALGMRDEFRGSDAIAQAIFLAAICAEDDSIFADNRDILTDYAHILDAYFKPCPLEKIADGDRTVLTNNYPYIAFAAGMQAGDRLLNIFSENRDLCFEVKSNYLMNCGRYDVVLSEDMGGIDDGNANHMCIAIECCLRTGKYEEALRYIEDYLQNNFITPDLLHNLLLISEKTSGELKSNAKALHSKYMCLYDEYIDLEDVANTGYVTDVSNKKAKKYLRNLSAKEFDALISSPVDEPEWAQLTDIRFKAAATYEGKNIPAMAEPIYRRMLACGGDSMKVYARLSEVYKALNNVTFYQHVRDKYL